MGHSSLARELGAVGGGFHTDDAFVLLNGSVPTGTTQWAIEVTNLGNASASWIRYGICF